MPRYTRNLDDVTLDELDFQFVGFNDYLRADQLAPGMLSYSGNGRIDGTWTVRKGIDLHSAPLTKDTQALTIPFNLYADNSTGTVTSPASGDEVVISFPAAHGFAEGRIVNVSGLTSTPDVNGNRLVTEAIAYTLSGSSETAINGDWYLLHDAMDTYYGSSFAGAQIWAKSGSTLHYINTDRPLSLVTQPGTGVYRDYYLPEYIMFRIGSVPFATWGIQRYDFTQQGATSILHFKAVTSAATPDAVVWTDADATGPVSISVSATPTVKFAVSGIDGQTITGTPTLGSPKIDESAINAVYGSCAFTDPSANDAAYVIIAGNNNATAINLADSTDTTTIDYPTGVQIGQKVDMIQALNKVFIFRDGETALEWDGDLSGTPAFTKVASGTYTQPVEITSANNTTIADGVVSVSATAHGLSVGDKIYVTNAGTSPLVEADTGSYTIATVPTDNSFTFYATVEDTAATTVVYMKKQSVGLGYSHMPSPPWAIFHQYRLIMPFKYTVDAGVDSFTSRNINDEIIASDILDSDTYDQIYGQFRFNAGTSDYVVGLLGFADDKLVVFNRNSIHLVVTPGAVEESSVQLLTQEVGLIARRSVQQIGSEIIFLSDNGIYGANFQDLYNLRGSSVPLSLSINNTIARINKDYAHNAVSAYYDNRYYIAVPLDDSKLNNAILIFNFLNKQWESIDTVNDINWDVENLIVDGLGSDRGIYAVNSLGGVHKLDAREDDKDRVATEIGATGSTKQILGRCETRGYTLGQIDRKRWNRFEWHLESSSTNASDGTISAEYENLDSDASYGNISNILGSAVPASEDVSLRSRLGNRRSYNVKMKLNTTQGRPKLRAVKVSGTTAFRSTLKAE